MSSPSPSHMHASVTSQLQGHTHAHAWVQVVRFSVGQRRLHVIGGVNVGVLVRCSGGLSDFALVTDTLASPTISNWAWASGTTSTYAWSSCPATITGCLCEVRTSCLRKNYRLKLQNTFCCGDTDGNHVDIVHCIHAPEYIHLRNTPARSAASSLIPKLVINSAATLPMYLHDAAVTRPKWLHDQAYSRGHGPALGPLLLCVKYRRQDTWTKADRVDQF